MTGVPPSSRTSPCGRADATARLRTAHAYLDVAELVLGERDRDEYLNVAAGLAVLAGIAAPTPSAVFAWAAVIAATITAAQLTSSGRPHQMVPNWRSPCCGFWISRMPPTTAS
jgi:hypothetical protein